MSINSPIPRYPPGFDIKSFNDMKDFYHSTPLMFGTVAPPPTPTRVNNAVIQTFQQVQEAASYTIGSMPGNTYDEAILTADNFDDIEDPRLIVAIFNPPNSPKLAIFNTKEQWEKCSAMLRNGHIDSKIYVIDAHNYEIRIPVLDIRIPTLNDRLCIETVEQLKKVAKMKLGEMDNCAYYDALLAIRGFMLVVAISTPQAPDRGQLVTFNTREQWEKFSNTMRASNKFDTQIYVIDPSIYQIRFTQ